MGLKYSFSLIGMVSDMAISQSRPRVFLRQMSKLYVHMLFCRLSTNENRPGYTHYRKLWHLLISATAKAYRKRMRVVMKPPNELYVIYLCIYKKYCLRVHLFNFQFSNVSSLCLLMLSGPLLRRILLHSSVWVHDKFYHTITYDWPAGESRSEKALHP